MILSLDLGQMIGWVKGAGAVGPLERGTFTMPVTTKLGKWLAGADEFAREVFPGVTAIAVEQPWLGVLAELDRFYKLRDSTEQEIEDFVRNMWRHATAIFTGLADQLDLFVQKSPREKLAAFRHVGMMAGLYGKPAEPPPNLVGDQMQAWLDGHGEGAASRKEAQDELADAMAEALNTAAAGGVMDATGKGRRKSKDAAKVEEVRAQAEKDFVEDHPDVPLPEPQAPKGRYRLEGDVADENGQFALYQGGKVVGYFTPEAATLFPTLAAHPEEFEASPEELARQKGRAGAEDATDPLVVGGVRYPNKKRADAARKLAEQNAGVQQRAIEEAKRPDSVA